MIVIFEYVFWGNIYNESIFKYNEKCKYLIFQYIDRGICDFKSLSCIIYKYYPNVKFLWINNNYIYLDESADENYGIDDMYEDLKLNTLIITCSQGSVPFNIINKLKHYKIKDNGLIACIINEYACESIYDLYYVIKGNKYINNNNLYDKYKNSLDDVYCNFFLNNKTKCDLLKEVNDDLNNICFYEIEILARKLINGNRTDFDNWIMAEKMINNILEK